MYNGDPGFVNETIEPYYAARWYEANKDNQRDVKEMFFGDFEVFTFYMLNKHDPESSDDNNIPIPPKAKPVTNDFAEFL